MSDTEKPATAKECYQHHQNPDQLCQFVRGTRFCGDIDPCPGNRDADRSETHRLTEAETAALPPVVPPAPALVRLEGRERCEIQNR